MKILTLFKRLVQFVFCSKCNSYEVRNLFENSAYRADRRYANKIYKSIHLSEISLCNMLDSKDDVRGCVIVFSSEMNHRDFDIAAKLNEFIKKYNATCYILDCAMRAKYIEQSSDTKFDKESLTAELIGLSDEQCIELTKELCCFLKQQSVLVRSINTKSIWCITKLK